MGLRSVQAARRIPTENSLDLDSPKINVLQARPRFVRMQTVKL